MIVLYLGGLLMIREHLNAVKTNIANAAERVGRKPENIKLVAVSKTRPASDIVRAIDAGHFCFGENRVQEAVEKIVDIPHRAEWHLVGHLQSNKAKTAVKYFDMIQSVDSIKLVREINKQAQKISKIQSILIQVNIADEDTKFGVPVSGVSDLVKAAIDSENINLQGMMTIPPFLDDPEKIRPFFKRLRRMAFDELVVKDYISEVSLEISMGMSNDYEVAIEEGASIVRIGTAIFGSRNS